MTPFRPTWSRRPSQRAFWFAGWMVLSGIGAVCGATEALASSAAEAEAVRLDEEMRKFAQRNIWDAVDSSYARLRGLASKGVALAAEQHELGAQAARELGRMREARARYRLALSVAVDLSEQARLTSVLDDIDRRYGRAELAAASRIRRDAQLVMVPAPFASDARASISHANAELRMTGSFNGLLPIGEYTLGATSFVVAEAGGVVRAEAMVAQTGAEAPQKQASAPKPKPEPEPKPKREREPRPKAPGAGSNNAVGSGFYAALGGGSATWLSRASTAGIYVPAGTGASVRLAGGGMWAVGSVAIVAELAWDGLYGSGGAQTAVNMAGAGAGLAFGSETFHGRVLGQLGGGWASFTGVDPESACQTDTSFAPATLPASAPACAELDVWGVAVVEGGVASPGVLLGGVWSPPALGRVGFGLDVGLRGVNGQMIPWTSVGVRYDFGGSSR